MTSDNNSYTDLYDNLPGDEIFLLGIDSIQKTFNKLKELGLIDADIELIDKDKNIDNELIKIVLDIRDISRNLYGNKNDQKLINDLRKSLIELDKANLNSIEEKLSIAVNNIEEFI